VSEDLEALWGKAKPKTENLDALWEKAAPAAQGTGSGPVPGQAGTPPAQPYEGNAVSSYLRHLVQGATGNSMPQLYGALTAPTHVLDDPRHPIDSLVKGYRSERDEEKRLINADAEHNPVPSTAGTLTGAIAGFGKLGAATGLAKLGRGVSGLRGLALRMLGSAGTGAIQGGVGAAQASDADLSRGEVDKYLDRLKEGAELGGALGAGGHLLGEGIAAVAKPGARAAQLVSSKAQQLLAENEGVLAKRAELGRNWEAANEQAQRGAKNSYFPPEPARPPILPEPITPENASAIAAERLSQPEPWKAKLLASGLKGATVGGGVGKVLSSTLGMPHLAAAGAGVRAVMGIAKGISELPEAARFQAFSSMGRWGNALHTAAKGGLSQLAATIAAIGEKDPKALEQLQQHSAPVASNP